MGYVKLFVRVLAILIYVPLGYVAYLYVVNFLPEHGMLDNIGWGVLTLLLFSVPINMWKSASKL